jgi:dTDP-4-amino-4,6-dideoxygalactose transaminase
VAETKLGRNQVRPLDQRPAIAGGKPVRSRERYLVFGAPALGEEEIAEVVATLRSGWIGTGPRVARFEGDFARYVQRPHAVALASCTAALHLALLAAEIGPGDEVITTPLTFCATVNAILHAGAVPVLADCDPETGNLDPARVAERIGPRTRAILPVHLAGRPCDAEGLGELARRSGLLVIGDCAHAIEACDAPGRHVAHSADLACFSFYATKNLTTAEGGMLVTSDPRLAARVKTLALHGMSHDAWKRFSDEGYVHYEVTEAGFKYNMTDLQASLGLHQLARIETNLRRREAIWRRYDEAFADLPLELPAPPAPGTRHARHLYQLRVETGRCLLTRDRFLAALHAEGIGGGVHYRSISEHAFYRERLGLKPGELHNAEDIGRRSLSIPLSAALPDADVGDVVEAVRRIALAHAAY